MDYNWASIVRRDYRTDRNVYSVQHAWFVYGKSACGKQKPEPITDDAELCDTPQPRCKKCATVLARATP